MLCINLNTLCVYMEEIHLHDAIDTYAYMATTVSCKRQ